MVFSKNTYPMLDCINGKDIFGMMYLECDEYKYKAIDDLFHDLWDAKYKQFNNSVKYICSTLNDAINQAGAKLVNDEMIGNIDTQSGVLLMADKVQICYDIINKGNDNIEMTVYCFYSCEIRWFIHSENIYLDEYKTFISSNCVFPLTNDKDICTKRLLPNLIATLNFLKYAKVETKYLKSGGKIKENNIKTVNTSNSSIQIIDSAWFTTLIKSDAFKVRGHFRLQPCGEGFKDKKLIYIEDFTKNGYVRQAKKLSVYGDVETIS